MGNNSLGFIAMVARYGYTDPEIREMYDYALKNDLLVSKKVETWKKALDWYGDKQSAARP